MAEPKALSTSIASVGTSEGRERLAAYLALLPFPHFEAAPDDRGLLVKIDEDGVRTRGHFVRRVFTPVER